MNSKVKVMGNTNDFNFKIYLLRFNKMWADCSKSFNWPFADRSFLQLLLFLFYKLFVQFVFDLTWVYLDPHNGLLRKDSKVGKY